MVIANHIHELVDSLAQRDLMYEEHDSSDSIQGSWYDASEDTMMYIGRAQDLAFIYCERPTSNSWQAIFGDRDDQDWFVAGGTIGAVGYEKILSEIEAELLLDDVTTWLESKLVHRMSRESTTDLFEMIMPMIDDSMGRIPPSLDMPTWQ